HWAGVPSPGICFAPHMASPTSPVSVCLPAAATGLDTNRFAETTNAAISTQRCQLLLIPVSFKMNAARACNPAKTCASVSSRSPFANAARGGNCCPTRGDSQKLRQEYPQTNRLGTSNRACSENRNRLFRRLHRIDEIDIDGLVSDVGSHMRCYIPVQGGREKLMGGEQVFAQISRIVNFSRADLPGAAEFRCQTVVEAAIFEFAHVIDVALLHLEADGHGAGGIIKLGVRLDGTGEKSPGTVELLNVFQVI